MRLSIVGDQEDSIHFAVAQTADRLWLPILRMPPEARAYLAARTRAGATVLAGPNERIGYLRTVSYAWFTLGVITIVILLLLDGVGHALAGNVGRTGGDAIGAALMAFCVAGAAYSTWKTAIALLARQRARRYGAGSERYVRLAARTRLRNSSLVGQAVFAVIVFLFVVAIA